MAIQGWKVNLARDRSAAIAARHVITRASGLYAPTSTAPRLAKQPSVSAVHALARGRWSPLVIVPALSGHSHAQSTSAGSKRPTGRWTAKWAHNHHQIAQPIHIPLDFASQTPTQKHPHTNTPLKHLKMVKVSYIPTLALARSIWIRALVWSGTRGGTRRERSR
jgi:hypothetical protein